MRHRLSPPRRWKFTGFEDIVVEHHFLFQRLPHGAQSSQQLLAARSFRHQCASARDVLKRFQHRLQRGGAPISPGNDIFIARLLPCFAREIPQVLAVKPLIWLSPAFTGEIAQAINHRLQCRLCIPGTLHQRSQGFNPAACRNHRAVFTLTAIVDIGKISASFRVDVSFNFSRRR